MNFDVNTQRRVAGLPELETHLTIRVEGQPPSGNHMYEGYGKNRRKSAKVTDYQSLWIRWTRMAMRHGWKPGKQIVVEFDFAFGRDMDCTNAMKVIEDGIAEAICPGLDPPRCCRKYDSRFLCRAMSKTIGNPKPYVEAVIW